MRDETFIKELAIYYISNRTTHRETGTHFGIGKSSVCFLLNHELPKINYGLYLLVREITEINLKERYKRGGKKGGGHNKKYTHEIKPKSVHKGVVILKNGKYNPHICSKGKRIYLGTYDTLEEAINVRHEAERKYFN